MNVCSLLRIAGGVAATTIAAIGIKELAITGAKINATSMAVNSLERERISLERELAEKQKIRENLISNCNN